MAIDWLLLGALAAVPIVTKWVIVTDTAVNIAPTMEDKVHIIQNAIDLAHALRFAEVRVAILSAMETVNSKVPSTVELVANARREAAQKAVA